MTFRSRITKRTAHKIARAGRVSTRRDQELERGASSAPSPQQADDSATHPASHGSATLWDVPRQLDTAAMTVAPTAPARPAPRRRSTITAVPVDWSAVRSSAAS